MAPASTPDPSSEPASQQPIGWRETITVYVSAPALRMFFLGFSAGLPLLLVLGTLSFRLREAGVEDGAG